MAVDTPGAELARVQAAVRMPTDPAFAPLAAAVRTGGRDVTDQMIQALLDAGHTEDDIFECIVAAAVGAGVERVRSVEQLLGTK
ncbi:MAG TPA: hypothetical protein VF062_03060 [Candidatus Limnocylindrales bacterium]